MKYKGINMYIIYLYIKMGYCGIIGVCGFCKDYEFIFIVDECNLLVFVYFFK